MQLTRRDFFVGVSAFFTVQALAMSAEEPNLRVGILSDVHVDKEFKLIGNGEGDGLSTRVLSKYPNGVAFSGHSHNALTDELSIWRCLGVSGESIHSRWLTQGELSC